MTIKELEELAKEFIIGYAPLTEKQIGLLTDIRQLEERRERLQKEILRYDKLIQTLYIKLAEG